MDEKFKATLVANLEEVQAKLHDLLNTKGSVTDICEVDSEILDMALNLQENIKRYHQYLAQPTVKRVAYYPRPRITVGRRHFGPPIVQYSEDGE